MCYFLLNDIMDLHMSCLGTLVSEGTCTMQQGVSLLKSNGWPSFLLVLWFNTKHTHKDTEHTQGPKDSQHTIKNIYYH